MQHQLYDEVADCYKKIARFFCQPNVAESMLAHQSLEFARSVSEATEAESMQLAIALSDMAHCCADTVHWMFSEAQDVIHDAINLVSDPAALTNKIVDVGKSLGWCLSKVMRCVADAMVHADSEGIGWSYYAELLEKEHQYEAEYAEQLVAAMKGWVEQSSAEQKVRAGTRLVLEGALCSAGCNLLSSVSKACCGMVAEVPELTFLGSFADLSAEYHLATEFGEVGLHSMQDLGVSILKSEINTFKKGRSVKSITGDLSKVAKSEKQTAEVISKKVTKDFTNEEKLIKATHNKEFWSRKGANGVANNANAREGLVEKIESLLSGQKNAVKVRKLSDGRIRYYKAEKLSKKPGYTRGSSYVTEYDPNRGVVRAWQECYDHLGSVNRVHPKSLNGADVVGQHYPPIGKEIEFWKSIKD